MSEYARLKKLDEESLQKLTEGPGPADQCICPLLAAPEEKKGIAASVKKVFKAIGRKSGNTPLSFTKNAKGLHSTREEVERASSCGKCGCDNEKIFLKHSYANIRITSPTVSSICPCDSDCLPDKDKYQNNIKVIVENAQVSSEPELGKS